MRKTPDDTSGAKCDLYVRQAENARRLGNLEKAATSFAAASKLNPGSTGLTLAHADVLFERKSWAEAQGLYQRVRELTGEGAGAQERVRVSERLAACAEQLADLETAAHFYEEALALAPDKCDAIVALIGVRARREEWQAQLDLERRLLALASSPAERAGISDTVGDLLANHLGDWPGAMAAYEEALRCEPERRPTLYKMLEYFTQKREWSAAVATLHKLASLESDAVARAKLNYAAAAIYRDELSDVGAAIALFSQVLADQPLHPKAFEAIEKLLCEGQQWQELSAPVAPSSNVCPTMATAPSPSSGCGCGTGWPMQR